jgi:hypothetical protein
VDSVQSNVATNATNINTVQANVTSLTTSVNTIKANVDSVQSNVSSLQANVVALESSGGGAASVINAIVSETASRSLILADASDMLFANTASNIIFTIPNDETVNFPSASTIHFARNGAGTVTISGDAGVTVRIRNGFTNTLAVQYSIASTTKVAANSWYLYGDLT